jgi:type II secretory pathway pseudopilin PulG
MKKCKQSAFSLIELLVATAVTAIIVGLMVTMVSSLLTAYNRSSGVLSAQSQANFVMDQLATEIQSMLVRNSDVDVMFELSFLGGVLGDSGKPNDIDLPAPIDPDGDPPLRPRPIAQDRFSQGGMQLRFFTAGPSLVDDPLRGVRKVTYRIYYEPVTSASGSPRQFMMSRSEESALDTFETGYNLNNYTEGAFSENNIIAGNVIDFGVRVYTFNNNRERVMRYPFTSTVYAAPIMDPYPRAIEVMIRILTPEGERLLKAFADGNLPGANWWDLAEQNSEVFSRVINIPSRPL